MLPPMTWHPSRLSRRQLLAAAMASSAWGLGARTARAEELLRLSARPENYETPASVFTQRITPVASFYIRSHFDRPVLDGRAWRLRVGGLVNRPLELSLTELAGLEQVEVEAVLQCAGNGRALFEPRLPGVQWRRGAMGNAVWRGVRLADVLRRARPEKSAAHLVMAGADRPVMPRTPAFVRSIPLGKALHEDTLIATHMNGAPLTPSHGFPARVVVPGWVGDDWIKWISELTLSDREPPGFFSEKAYRFPDPPGSPGEAVPPELMKQKTRWNVKSLIATPAPGAVLRPGPVEVVGVAFSGGAAIRRVEVTGDGGATWRAAELEGPPAKYGWRVYRGRLELEAGTAKLGARATDARGEVQPERPVWNPSGYLYNAVDLVPVEVKA